MKSLEPFDCARVELHSADLVAGRADAAVTAAIHAHTESCSSCRERLADAAEMWTELGRWQDEEPSPALAQRFHHWLAAETATAASQW
jgi:predicted anti-sigma-YlaC factor YlaD